MKAYILYSCGVSPKQLKGMTAVFDQDNNLNECFDDTTSPRAKKACFSAMHVKENAHPRKEKTGTFQGKSLDFNVDESENAQVMNAGSQTTLWLYMVATHMSGITFF